MCLSNSVLSAIHNILSSTEGINGTCVYCPIAFDRASARTDFDDLAETLKSYASHKGKSTALCCKLAPVDQYLGADVRTQQDDHETLSCCHFGP